MFLLLFHSNIDEEVGNLLKLAFFLLIDINWTVIHSAKASKNSENSQADAGDFNSNDPDLREYSLADIEVATDRFSIENKLGEGGYGPVYKVMYR